MRKASVTAILAGAFLLAAAVPAMSNHWPDNRMDPATTGAAFGGWWEWFSYFPQESGSYRFWGYLADTICNDGDAPYSKVTTYGQNAGPFSYYGTMCVAGSVANTYQDYTVPMHPSLTHLSSVDYQVCRDRSFPYADNCSAAVQARRA